MVALVVGMCVGSAFAQQQGDRPRRQGGPGMGFGAGEMGLVSRSDVQKDLGITDEQKKSIDAAREKLRPERGSFGGGGGGTGTQRFDPAQFEAMMKKRREDERKELSAILSADQLKRLDEISIQVRGSRALSDPEVQAKLGLSDAQKAKIKSLFDAQREANQTIREKQRNQEITGDQARESRANNEKILDAELAKVLTADQAAKLKDLGGKPFAADPQENRGPGGRGPGGGGPSNRGGL